MEDPKIVEGVEYVNGHEQAQQAGEFTPQDAPTLRDQFAMAALTGLLCVPIGSQYTNTMAASDAYNYADAMLAAREAG